jgi:hypothetical protein
VALSLLNLQQDWILNFNWGLEKEVKSLVCEFDLELAMGGVLFAVNYEVVGVSAIDLAQLTSHSGCTCLTFRISLTAVALFLLLCPSVVKLILQLEGGFVLWLPEATVPLLNNSTWKHQLDLRDVSQVIPLFLNDANNVTFSTLTKGKILENSLF